MIGLYQAADMLVSGRPPVAVWATSLSDAERKLSFWTSRLTVWTIRQFNPSTGLFERAGDYIHPTNPMPEEAPSMYSNPNQSFSVKIVKEVDPCANPFKLAHTLNDWATTNNDEELDDNAVNTLRRIISDLESLADELEGEL